MNVLSRSADHKAADCTEPRSAADVECRKCNEGMPGSDRMCEVDTEWYNKLVISQRIALWLNNSPRLVATAGKYRTTASSRKYMSNMFSSDRRITLLASAISPETWTTCSAATATRVSL